MKKKNNIAPADKRCIVAIASAAFVALLVAVAAAGPLAPESVQGGVEFVYEAASDAGKIAVAGEFNSWNHEKDFLKYDSARKLWTTVISLGEGRYEYKFVVGGTWQEGANLAIEVKKKDGRLVVEEPAAAPNTPYSSKINFSGSFVAELGAQSTSPTDDFSSIPPVNHADFDWNITASKDASGFARLEYDGDKTSGKLLFKQGRISFAPTGFETTIYYKEKAIQFDDPLRATDRAVTLKYDAVEFFDETNPHKAFGLWEQAVALKTGFLGGDFSAFYSDMLRPATNFHTLEDNYGLRYARSFKSIPLKIAFTTRQTRGGWWPWANSDNNWFPDPENPNGYSLDAAARGSVATWYNGYLNEDFAGVDGKFDFLPGVALFGETASVKKELKTQKISGGGAHEKIWTIESGAEHLFGLKYSHGKILSLQASASGRNTTFTPPLYAGETFAAGGAGFSLAARLRAGSFTLAATGASQKNSRIEKILPLDLHPYAHPLVYRGLFPLETATVGFLVHAVEEENAALIVAEYSESAFSVGAKSKISSLKLLPRTETGGIWRVNPFISALDEITLSESLLDAAVKIRPDITVESAFRLFAWDDKNESGLKTYSAIFLALKYGFSKNSYIRLGWGLDPEDTDDDILAGFDARESFLYNLGAASVLEAARALESLRRISVRMVVKF
ncbi:MAG: glycogen-binding domain-containing protein [Endomicrobiia bacterium]|nr:glycogen-binding domain-containing protein [Endomicrobiia bacterium]